jgi:hypothetical protein
MTYPNLNLLTASLQDIVLALSRGAITSEELAKQYLGMCSTLYLSIKSLARLIGTARIEKDNINGLGLRAVLELAPTDLRGSRHPR